jgi:hypothetical protein
MNTATWAVSFLFEAWKEIEFLNLTWVQKQKPRLWGLGLLRNL